MIDDAGDDFGEDDNDGDDLVIAMMVIMLWKMVAMTLVNPMVAITLVMAMMVVIALKMAITGEDDHSGDDFGYGDCYGDGMVMITMMMVGITLVLTIGDGGDDECNYWAPLSPIYLVLYLLIYSILWIWFIFCIHNSLFKGLFILFIYLFIYSLIVLHVKVILIFLPCNLFGILVLLV